MAKNKSVLNNVALAYAEDPAEYGKVFKQFIKKNRDEEGNILDDEKEQDMVVALRNSYDKMDNIEYCEITERIIQIEQFGISEHLQEFIDFTKRFLVAAEKEPKRIMEFLSFWEPKAAISTHDLSFENHLRVELIDQIYNYIGGKLCEK